jgi:hypothetical protein
MKYKLLLTLLSLIIISLPILSFSSSVAADDIERWYARNARTSCYGVKADISANTYTPGLSVNTGLSSWVSTLNYNNCWVQTGWHYNYGMNYAYSYTEFRLGAITIQQDISIHSWSSYKNYKVSYDSPYWKCYINNTLYLYVSGGGYLPTPPTTLLASAEIKGSSGITMDSAFSSVQYMNSLGSWNNFDQNNKYAMYPYHITGYNYNFYTYGPQY